MKRIGRPPQPKNRVKSVQVNVRFDPVEVRRLKFKMKENGLTQYSQIIRLALTKAFGI